MAVMMSRLIFLMLFEDVLKALKVLLAAVFLGALVQAASALTLDECQAAARENHPLLKRYDMIKQTTEYSVKNVRSGYYPQLLFSAQASYQSDVTTLPDALVTMLEANGYDVKGLDKDQYRIALELNQVIWDGGNIGGQKQVTQAKGDVLTAQADVDMYALRGRVNELYFGVLLIDEKIKLNEDLQKLLSANCEKLEAMVKNGIAMEADVNSLRAELLGARQKRSELDAARRNFVKILSIFTGKGEDELTDLEKPSAGMPLSQRNNRPELALMDAQLRQNSAQRKIVNSGVYPRLSLFAQGFYGYTGYDMFNDMFDHDFTFNGIIGLRLTWNLSKWYTHKNDGLELDVAREQIENAREVFLFNDSLQTAQESAEIEKFRELMREDDEIIALRVQVREASEVKLERGIIDVNTLLQEITRENQARLEQSAHEIELLKHIYELKHTINQ